MFDISELNGDMLGSAALTSLQGILSIPAIDLTASVLDSRVQYLCDSAHLYWGQNGSLQTAPANTWPLEYKNGIAVGRHEPEPAATNYQKQMRGDLTVLSGQAGEFIRSATLSLGAGVGPDGGAIGSTLLAQVGSGIYSEATSSWLIGPIDLTISANWQRYYQTFSASGVIRTYTARSTALLFAYGLATLPAAGTYTASHYRRSDGLNMLTGFVQIEQGSLATSPIITANDVLTRNGSSVQIQLNGATGIVIRYSDGTSFTAAVSGSTYSLPLASKNWGERYITRIEFTV